MTVSIQKGRVGKPGTPKEIGDLRASTKMGRVGGPSLAKIGRLGAPKMAKIGENRPSLGPKWPTRRPKIDRKWPPGRNQFDQNRPFYLQRQKGERPPKPKRIAKMPKKQKRVTMKAQLVERSLCKAQSTPVEPGAPVQQADTRIRAELGIKLRTVNA